MEKQKINTVIFDLDGTLLDTLDDLTDSANAAMKAYGFPVRSREEVRSFVGNGIRNLIRQMVPGGEENEAFEQTLDYFTQYYGEHCMDLTSPYPGICELLFRLKQEGCHLAVVSNKADFAVKKLSRLYFKDLFEISIGERNGVRRKPEPDMVREALNFLNAEPDRAVYVGDSEVDIKTAENTGLEKILVTWGFRDKKFLEQQGAELFARDAEELEKMLLKTE